MVLFNEHLSATVEPWGVSFATNLTPDKETGMAGWTEDMFIAAMRTGKTKDVGRPILPQGPGSVWPLLLMRILKRFL